MKPYAAKDFERHRRLDKRALEKQTILGCLERLGLNDFELELSERPDALIRFSGSNEVKLACELQSLQADRKRSGSRLREFHGRWLRIMEQVDARLRSEEPLVPYCVVDGLREQDFRKYRDEELAEEFVAARPSRCRVGPGKSSARYNL